MTTRCSKFDPKCQGLPNSCLRGPKRWSDCWLLKKLALWLNLSEPSGLQPRLWSSQHFFRNAYDLTSDWKPTWQLVRNVVENLYHHTILFFSGSCEMILAFNGNLSCVERAAAFFGSASVCWSWFALSIPQIYAKFHKLLRQFPRQFCTNFVSVTRPVATLKCLEQCGSNC